MNRKRSTRKSKPGNQGLTTSMRSFKIAKPGRKKTALSPQAIRLKKGNPRTALLVLGMHRSGTSAITRVLSLLGCSLPKTLMAATDSNEAGHWESSAIAQLNDKILESAGTNWHDWVEFNPGWYESPTAVQFHEEALASLYAEVGSQRLFVLKDPRICKLTPFWLDALKEFGSKTHIVLPIRNPLEVAISLQKRNGFDPSLGHLLWLRYVLDAEFATRGHARFFVSYDSLLGDWRAAIERLQKALDVRFPRLSQSASSDIKAFLNERNRHVRIDTSALADPDLSPWMRDCYEILERWARKGEVHKDRITLDRIRNSFNTAGLSFNRVVAISRYYASSRQRIEQELEAQKNNSARLEQTSKSLEEQLKIAREQAEKLENEKVAITKEFKDTRDKLAQTESALLQRRHESEQTREELSVAREEVKQLTLAKEKAEKSLEVHQTELGKQLQEHSEKLFASREEVKQLTLAKEKAEKSLEVHQTELGKRNSELHSARAHAEKQLQEHSEKLVASREEVKQLTLAKEKAEKSLEVYQTELGRRNSELESVRAEAKKQLEERFGEIAILTNVIQKTKDANNHLRVGMASLVGLTKADSVIGQAWQSLTLKRKIKLLRHSGFFDAEWYLKANADVRAAGLDPFRHYVEFGVKEGRAPNPALAQLAKHT